MRLTMIRTIVLIILTVGLSQATEGCLKWGYCLNGGICNISTNTCDCPPGFTGTRCSIGVAKTACALDPCKNGGICQLDVLSTEGYSCKCEPGFEGPLCDEDIDECTEEPCGAGQCINTLGGYQCNCPEHLVGDHCERKVDICELYESKNESFCLNGGECRFDRCGCAPGWAGQRCERIVPFLHEMVEMGCSASLRQAQYCLESFGDGVCDHQCSSESCMFDGFDCPSPHTKHGDHRLEGCRNADFCSKVYADGTCHEECATAECGFDGFDCKPNVTERLPDSELVGVTVLAPPHVTLSNIRLLQSGIGMRLYNGHVNVSYDRFGPLVFEDLTDWSQNITSSYSVKSNLGQRIDSDGAAVNSSAISTTVFFDIDVTSCQAGNGATRVGEEAGDVINCFQNVQRAAQFLRMHLSRNRVRVGRALEVRLVQTINREPSQWRRALPFFLLVGVTLLFVVSVLSVFVVFNARKRKLKEVFAPVWTIPRGNQYHPPTPPYDTDSLDLCDAKSKLYPDLKMKKENNYNTFNVNERSPLLKAVCHGDLTEVKKLLSSLSGVLDENVDSQGLNVLHHAVANNDMNMLRLLLTSGAFDVTERNFLGQSPIVYAARVGHPQIDSYIDLLNALAEKQQRFYSLDVNEAKASRDCVNEPLSFDHDERWSLIDDLGRSVVHYSSVNNLPLLIHLFASRGADVNLIDYQGDTPLHVAAKNGNTEALQALLQCGASSDSMDHNGMTAYHLALEGNHFDVLPLLSGSMQNVPCSPVAYSAIKKGNKHHNVPSVCSSFGSSATLTPTWEDSFYDQTALMNNGAPEMDMMYLSGAQSSSFDCTYPDHSSSNAYSDWENSCSSMQWKHVGRSELVMLTPPSAHFATTDGLNYVARVPEMANGNTCSTSEDNSYYAPSAVYMA